jgi:hypothetical protein
LNLRAALLLPLALVGLLCAGCAGGGGAADREGEAIYLQARARYEALLAEGRSARDPAFDEVLGALERVPSGSPAGNRAAGLAERLRTARQPPPPRPLATAHAAHGDHHADDCVGLAQALGRAKDAERERVSRQLEACRLALEKHKAGDHGHAH